jgi:hypothetical protein
VLLVLLLPLEALLIAICGPCLRYPFFCEILLNETDWTTQQALHMA